MGYLRKLRILVFALSFNVIFLSFAIALARSADESFPSPLPTLIEPSMSPDGTEIAFVSAGDVWTVAASGGEARLLVSHPASESRPLYSPDGRRLAFISTRTGNGDIYLLTLATGELRRLTFNDAYDQLESWSRDGRWLYFSSSSRDIGSMNDIFRVSSDGGTPMAVSGDRYTNESFSAPSPDGRGLAFTARGIASSQWWRKGHSHADESEIWLMREGSPAKYERITNGGAKEMWPMWSPNGDAIFYVSDRSGAQNIWHRPLGGQARQLTQFKDGRVLWPTISYDGRVIVFERDFGIWKFDTHSNQAGEIPITRRGALASPPPEHLTLSSQIQGLQISPDGKKVAFVVRGDLFAASAKEGGDAVRVTRTAANEYQICWSNDSQRLAYVSDRQGAPHIFIYDFRTDTETQLTNGAAEYAPRFSPDGRMIAFVCDGREIRVIELDSRRERSLTAANLERVPLVSERLLVWSPDSRWIAYLGFGDRLFKNAYVVPVMGGRSQPVSFLANPGGNTISWSPDSRFILFDTGRRLENGQIARVDLVKRPPKFREDLFRNLFKEGKPKHDSPNSEYDQPNNPGPRLEPLSMTLSPIYSLGQLEPETGPVEIVFDGIRQRLSLLPVEADVANPAISPNGKWVLMSATAAGQQNLYIYPLDELSKDSVTSRQLTSTPGPKRYAQFSPDSKEIYYLEQGRVNVMSLDTKTSRVLPVTVELDVDFEGEKREVFHQAWSYLRDHFFDEDFHGTNWQSVRSVYAPRIAGAHTPDEMRRLLLLMMGELNASHLGLSAPQKSLSTGRLGLLFDRTEYEAAGLLRVTEIIPFSPAAQASSLKPGDYLLAVDGVPIDGRTNLDELLNYKIGRRVVLTLAESARGTNKREVAVQPINSAAEKDLLYVKWVEDNRAYVEQVTKGRLGYIHMLDMSAASLSQLSIDLDTDNYSREGVIIDLRNNSGGFVNGHALDVFARRGYLTMMPRGLPSAPARSALGQRALEAPTILVVNQHTLSDAEEFTEGYRSLELGKVVGEPTAGWVIYTFSAELIDGSFLRIPNTKITASDGKILEMNPRPVDVPVVRPIGESLIGRDSQLEAAARELIKQLDAGHREINNRR